MTIAPALRDRKHPHSRRPLERVRRWFTDDHPWAYVRTQSPPAQIRYITYRAIKTCWLWRDVTPGPATTAALWLVLVWLGWPHPITPLAVIGAIVSVACIRYDSNHGYTANKDRHTYRILRNYQRACLDAKFEPQEIPDLDLDRVKETPYELTLPIAVIEGTDARQLYLKATRCLGNIYGYPAHYTDYDNGTGVIKIRKADPLAHEPALPAHLETEPSELTPTLKVAYNALPLGVDQDGPFSIDLWQQSLLIPGRPRTGKSSTALALGCTIHAAPLMELAGALDPQGVSFGPLRGACDVAVTTDAALELMGEFHRSMQKREAEMDEAGTSLATPSTHWPIRVLLVDELLRYLDPNLQGAEYVQKFKALFLDLLQAGPKTGHVIIATATNPRADILTKGLRDMFTMTLCFKVRGVHASQVALGGGNVEAGFEPHKLPSTPGRAILMGLDLHQLRTYRLWDNDAREVIRNLTVAQDSTGPAQAQASGNGSDPPLTGFPVSQAVPTPTEPQLPAQSLPEAPQSLPPPPPSVAPLASPPPPPAPPVAPRGYGEARDLIRGCLQEFGPQKAREISVKTDIPISTVKRWLGVGSPCPDPLPIEKRRGYVYALVGDPRTR